MNDEEKGDYLRRLMASDKRDDLERASARFREMTNEELDEEHLESGVTRRELLQGLQRRRENWTQANDFLEGLLKRTRL